MNENKTVSSDKLFVAALAIGAFIATMNMTNINIALPFIISDFQSDMATIQWVVTGCMLTCGVIMPTVGYFMDRFGGRNLFLIGLFFFQALAFVFVLAVQRTLTLGLALIAANDLGCQINR